MQLEGVKPDSITFSSILPACAKTGALDQGMDIHQSMKDIEISSDLAVATALVDMYAKCGHIDKACVKPDSATIASILSACARMGALGQGFHAGLVDEGCTYFIHMSNPYCITPTVDHYVCMVDLLGRAGYLEDTLKFIIKMPVKPVVVVWICFLGACRSHMNIGLGEFTATLLFDLDPQNVATYVLLSNIYAEVGMWGEAQMVRRLMKDKGINKIPGCSWIEGHKMIHAFCVGDRSHP
ncbi:putative pentatricopeptide repeat-containing protein At3g49142 [Cryptomeria japonica]|uniref:putative pentatricopeptide repeat-containing protein At3g49142 n=1 Tax=Cryptomeria japonica TaxID=3369 RepID=UPI0027DA8DDF|nr:putative pentatricopeptide repeat-containing protein At3g49142 [Cryptomeria japonica]